MRKVELTMNEQIKYEVIKKVSEGLMRKTKAEVTLGLSRRQIDRLIASYRQNGKETFKHKNRGRASSRATDSELKEKVVQLYLSEKYHVANITHFTELLASHEGISLSRTTVNTVLLEADILSPKAHKKTRRTMTARLEESLKEVTSNQEEASITEKIVAIENAHPMRPRAKYAGELIQLDASQHFWISGEYWHLHIAIDDATGDIIGAYFSKEETLHSYYHITKQIFERYGLPHKFLTDYRTVFNDNSKNNKPDEANSLTQFGYMCKQLGIELECTMIPQKKGRVERLFGTLQSRLVTEFKVHGITTIEQANVFLDSYVDEYNSRFGNKVNDTTTVFETPPSNEDINLYLAVLKKRIINQGHHFKFNHLYYVTIDSDGNEKFFPNKTEVLVINAFDGQIFASIDEQVYALKQLESHQRYSKEFDQAPTKTNQAKIYIPDFKHPWKLQNFNKFVYELELTPKDWENLQYSNHNLLANVDDVLRHFNF
jgi:transposase/transposase-like protein